MDEVGIFVLVMVGGGVLAFMIARSKGAPNALTWGLLGVLFPLFGVIGAAIFAKPAVPAQLAAPTMWSQSGGTQSGQPPAPAPGWGGVPPVAQPGAAPPLPVGGPGFCPRCGTARAPGFRYCASCGLDLDAPSG